MNNIGNILGFSLYRWAMRFLHIQLFITLASLPILVFWGLPLSIAAPLGNILFTPFLMAFLLLASLLFFLELFCLPNSWLAIALEKVVNCWQWTLSYNCPSWLLSFAKPSVLFCICLVVATFFILHHKTLSCPPKSTISFTLLLVITIAYLRLGNPTTKYLTIPCSSTKTDKHFFVVRQNSQTIFVDPGHFGVISSSSSWVEYTLLPTLSKQFGSTRIDHLIVMQPGTLIFEAVANVCRHTNVGAIHMVTWQGAASRQLYRNYGILKNVLQHKKIPLYRVGNKEQTIKLSRNKAMKLTPVEKKLHYEAIDFPALQVSITIDNQEITFYSAKMNMK